MDPNLLSSALITLAVGCVLYVFVYPRLVREVKAQERRASFVSATSWRVESKTTDLARRRKAISETLKDVEGNKRKFDLEEKILQSGLDISKKTFFLASAGCGVLLGGLLFVVSGDPLTGLGALIAGALGVPRWFLGYLRARRIRHFVEEFPAAIDIIVRGVRAGLPVGDCFRVAAAETQEPVRSEFRRIVEGQAIGMTMAESVDRFAMRVPTSEASFFAIVINLQQKAGGNLSEALANLSSVLRDRKKMKAKVKAISSEAKASAGIIGFLPFAVAGVVQFTSPGYLNVLFTTTQGNIIVAVSLTWMAIGVFVMWKMINFEV